MIQEWMPFQSIKIILEVQWNKPVWWYSFKHSQMYKTERIKMILSKLLGILRTFLNSQELQIRSISKYNLITN